MATAWWWSLKDIRGAGKSEPCACSETPMGDEFSLRSMTDAQLTSKPPLPALKKSPAPIRLILAECRAPARIFGEWEEMTPRDQALIHEQHGLPCDGGGVPGVWCVSRCYWSHTETIDNPSLLEDLRAEMGQ